MVEHRGGELLMKTITQKPGSRKEEKEKGSASVANGCLAKCAPRACRDAQVMRTV